MLARIGVAVASTLLLLGVSVGAWRVAALEAREVREVERRALRETTDGILVTASLSEGQVANFDVCAEDRMEPERWRGTMRLQVALDGEVGIDAPIDDRLLAAARRNETNACVEIGHGPVLAEGDYSIRLAYDADAYPEDIADVRLHGYITAREEVGDLDLAVVLLCWFGSLILLVALAIRAKVGTPPSPPRPDAWEEAQREIDGESESKRWPEIPGPPWLRVLAGLLALITLFFSISLITSGPASQLAIDVVFAALEVLLAAMLIGGATFALRLDTLGLARPAKWWFAWFPAAVVAGLGLMVLAHLATRLVPSTSTSAVQNFVSWPSGMLSFATLAVIAPLAEEVFFRGFVYGALAKRHWLLGFFGAWLTFAAFHATQTWGQWGALVAIFVTGLGLTTIRALSGSVLVAATAHLVYNGVLALRAFL